MDQGVEVEQKANSCIEMSCETGQYLSIPNLGTENDMQTKTLNKERPHARIDDDARRRTVDWLI